MITPFGYSSISGILTLGPRDTLDVTIQPRFIVTPERIRTLSDIIDDSITESPQS